MEYTVFVAGKGAWILGWGKTGREWHESEWWWNQEVLYYLGLEDLKTILVRKVYVTGPLGASWAGKKAKEAADSQSGAALRGDRPRGPAWGRVAPLALSSCGNGLHVLTCCVSFLHDCPTASHLPWRFHSLSTSFSSVLGVCRGTCLGVDLRQGHGNHETHT